jgi:hypothetical protein
MSRERAEGTASAGSQAELTRCLPGTSVSHRRAAVAERLWAVPATSRIRSASPASLDGYSWAAVRRNQWACTWDVGIIPSQTEPDGGRWIQAAAVALRLDLLNPALNLVQVVAHVLPYSAI